jgi:putative ABC transport system permease protein
MVSDVRYALRAFRRSPGFAVSAILALALGIGANTAVFSVVYAVLLKPLPYAHADRLVKLSEVNPAQNEDNGRVSRGTFEDWRARSRTLDGLAAFSSGGESLWTIGDRPQIVRVAGASPSLATVLSTQPILGTWFPEQGPGQAALQIVISYGLWQRMFGGASDVVGRRVVVEGRAPREIIGVMPRGFAFPERTEAWVRLAMGGPLTASQRRFMSYHAIGRLAPGATLSDVRREFDVLSAQLAVEQPESNQGWEARIVSLHASDTGEVRASLVALFAAVAGVLLIGCVNVANLLLARASARRHEIAVRVALGASTARLVRQSLTEATLLAAGGAITGLVIGQWLSDVLVNLAPPDVPRLADAGLDGAVLLFTAAVSVGSALLMGLAPAYHFAAARRRSTPRSERSIAPAAALPRRILIGGEVAVVVLLLTAALLFMRSFVQLRSVDLGFEPKRVWTVSTRWPVGRMLAPGGPWSRLQRAVDDLVEAVAGIPGVDAVGVIADVPLVGRPYDSRIWRRDAPGATGTSPPSNPRDRWHADLTIVTPGYFAALGIPFLRGRNFTDADRWTDAQLKAETIADPGVAIINQTFAERYFPGQDPVGRAAIVADDETFGSLRTIVGVVGDVRGHAVAQPALPALFIPHAQHPDVFLPSLIVRSSLPPEAFADVIRQRISAYDPQLLVQRIRPMEEVVSGALSRPRFNLLLVGTFAGLGLGLAAVGIYGVVAFLVTQRTREIGIRIALGARAADVRRLVLVEGMGPVAAGGVAGVVASLAATRLIRTLLFGVTAMDPVSLLAAPCLLTAVALLACYLPARRATRVDPLVALRED